MNEQIEQVLRILERADWKALSHEDRVRIARRLADIEAEPALGCIFAINADLPDEDGNIPFKVTMADNFKHLEHYVKMSVSMVFDMPEWVQI